jgi:hypothetical protein
MEAGYSIESIVVQRDRLSPAMLLTPATTGDWPPGNNLGIVVLGKHGHRKAILELPNRAIDCCQSFQLTLIALIYIRQN